MMKGFVIGMLLIGMFCGASHYEYNYTREDCVVVEATETGAIFEDKCGFTWYVECEGYKVGDVADLKMYNNHTDNCIDDDEVKDLIRVD